MLAKAFKPNLRFSYSPMAIGAVPRRTLASSSHTFLLAKTVTQCLLAISYLKEKGVPNTHLFCLLGAAKNHT